MIRGPFISPMPEAPEPSPLPTFLVVMGVAVAVFVAACLLLARPAYAHDAPSGWSYPFSCCAASLDCRPVPASTVSEKPDGYVINSTGEIVGYRDARVKDSPDGVLHWCSQGGSDTGRTICLFVPPRGY